MIPAPEGAAREAGAWRTHLADHRQHLWSVCYRMTGSASDADDLVQETFRRALESPPPDLARDARPWLVRVAMNLSRDALRERQRRGYIGTWLPSPVETPEASGSPLPGAEARYGELESVTFAFLLALETLTPSQRAVLLLRDVFDYSVDETAAALDLSAANVKTTLHRARRALAELPPSASPTPELTQRTRRALEAFLLHLLAGNVPALEELLAAGVRSRGDGNGEFHAARRPIVGIPKVIKFHLATLRSPDQMRAAVRILNGLPALVVETTRYDDPRIAHRLVIRIELDAAGRIATIDGIVAKDKLRAIDFDGLPKVSLLELLRSVRSALTTPPPWKWLPSAAGRLARNAVRAGIALARDRSAGAVSPREESPHAEPPRRHARAPRWRR